MSTQDFPIVRQLARASMLGQAAVRFGRVATAALDSSRFTAAARDGAAAFLGLPAAMRLRMCGVCLSVAAFTHLTARQLQPVHLIPALTGVIALLVGLAGLAVALGANVVAIAWPQSATRALWRRLVR